VIAWHRKGFRLFWTWVRRASTEELFKLGIDIGETSVSKYMVRQRKSPSQTWRTFLDNHVQQIVSVDFFTVPTIASRFCTSSWCCTMSGGEYCTATSRLIRLRNGLRSNFAWFDLRRLISNGKDLDARFYAVPYYFCASIVIRGIEAVGAALALVKPGYFASVRERTSPQNV